MKSLVMCRIRYFFQIIQSLDLQVTIFFRILNYFLRNVQQKEMDHKNDVKDFSIFYNFLSF
jgi:hypothetical protein